MSQTQRIAVVGAGISGLASAWLLSRQYDVTLFEANNYLGGHAHTVDVTLEGRTHPVDTGFLVFNEHTYPHLMALFDHLGVGSVQTDMSFSVSLETPNLEWAGSSLNTVFGQKRNLLRPSFWSMLSDILRFNRESHAWLATHAHEPRSLEDFLQAGRYSRAFADWYLLPMAAAIWSCPPQKMRDMPLETFIRFCQNHGLLQVFDRPMWRTVRGGARTYVRKMAHYLDDIRLSCPVRSIQRDQHSLWLEHGNVREHFDQVVVACHSPQALALVGTTASAGQRGVLQAIRYQPNRVVLHTDSTLLPRDGKLWSAWNYFAGPGEPGVRPVGVSYLMNQLQALPFKTPVVLTLNPARAPDPAKVIAEFDYAQPILDAAALAAQQQLAAVQGQNGIWLAGAWSRYGFHEDGLQSALQIANRLGVRAPWQNRQPVLPFETAAV